MTCRAVPEVVIISTFSDGVHLLGLMELRSPHPPAQPLRSACFPLKSTPSTDSRAKTSLQRDSAVEKTYNYYISLMPLKAFGTHLEQKINFSSIATTKIDSFSGYSPDSQKGASLETSSALLISGVKPGGLAKIQGPGISPGCYFPSAPK